MMRHFVLVLVLIAVGIDAKEISAAGLTLRASRTAIKSGVAVGAAAGDKCDVITVSHPTAIDGTKGVLTLMNLDHQMVCLVKHVDGKTCQQQFDSGKADAAGANMWCITNNNGFSVGSFGIYGTTSPAYGIDVRTWAGHKTSNAKLVEANAKGVTMLGTITAANCQAGADAIKTKIESLADRPPKYVATPTHKRDCHWVVNAVDRTLGEVAGGTDANGQPAALTATTFDATYKGQAKAALLAWAPASWGLAAKTVRTTTV